MGVSQSNQENPAGASFEESQIEISAMQLKWNFRQLGQGIDDIERSINTQWFTTEYSLEDEVRREPQTSSTELPDSRLTHSMPTGLSVVKKDRLSEQCNYIKRCYENLKLYILDVVESNNQSETLTPFWKDLLEEICRIDDDPVDSLGTDSKARSRKLQNYNPAKEINWLKREVRTLKVDRQKFDVKMQELSDTIAKLNKDKTSIEMENKTLREMTEKLRERDKPKVSIQLYYKRNDDLMMWVVNELEALLKTQMEDVEPVVIHCTVPDMIDPKLPTLVLCINSCRLGTDADTAIHGIRGDDTYALLIFHHMAQDAMKLTQPSDRQLTNSRYTNFGRIFDFHFHRGQGIYTCPQNETSLRGVASFCLENATENVKQSLSGNNATLKQQMSSVEDKNSLRNRNEGLTQEIMQLKIKIDSRNQDQRKLKTEINNLEEENMKLLKHHSHLTDESNRLRTECISLEKNNKALKTENDNLTRRYTKLSMEMNSAMAENETLRRMNKGFVNSVQMRQAKPKVPVQLYYARNDDLMTSVAHELDALLKTQMDIYGVEPSVHHFTHPSSLQSLIPTLVLCVNSSRLGTDVNVATQGIRGTGSDALLIFHHKQPNAIPRSDRILMDSGYSDFGRIFDLAFQKDKGIYACDLNDASLHGIVHFLVDSS